MISNMIRIAVSTPIVLLFLQVQILPNREMIIYLWQTTSRKKLQICKGYLDTPFQNFSCDITIFLKLKLRNALNLSRQTLRIIFCTSQVHLRNALWYGSKYLFVFYFLCFLNISGMGIYKQKKVEDIEVIYVDHIQIFG